MTVKKKVFLILILALLAAAAVFAVGRSAAARSGAKDGPYEISVLCRERSAESRAAVKAGIDQASNDLNAEVSYITLSHEGDDAEQISLLEREAANGADAVVIAPVRSAKLGQAVKEAAQKLPVVAILSAPEGAPGIPTVSCDDFRLGQSLAERVLKDGVSADPKIIVSGVNPKCGDSENLYRGVQDVFKRNKIPFSTLQLRDAQEAGAAARSLLPGLKNEVWVELDGGALEAVGQAKRELLKTGQPADARIYGAGRSDAVTSLLEERVISAVGVRNEYNIGYLGIKTAVDGIRRKKGENVQVNFIIADGTNLYSPENERILFPFVS